MPLVTVLGLAAALSTRVLVLDVQGDALTAEERGVLRDVVATAAHKQKTLDVMTSEDIRNVLDVEAQKQVLGCEGESSCLSEIAQALGADLVVYGAVGRLGERYVVNVSIVDVRLAKSAGRETFQAENVTEIADKLPEVAGTLLEPKSKKGKRERDEGRGGFPVVTTMGASVAAVGLLATALFGGATWMMADAAADPNGDIQLKQAGLDYGEYALIATAVSGGVLALGAGITLIGVAVE